MSNDIKLRDQRVRDLLRAARKFSPGKHVPLICQGSRVGWLRKTSAQLLLAWPDVFDRNAAGVHIADTLGTALARTAAIENVIHILRDNGIITGWRNERYAVVTEFNSAPLFHIERAAARFFGTTTFAAHANSYCGSGENCEIWIARRSQTKSIDPGMLDTLVGGGMSAGTLPLQTIVKEAWEEAGIPEALACKAVAAGTIAVLREVPEGVQSEVVFVHDLELPCEFEPRNQDGEVAGFQRLPISALVEILNEGADFTLDASLVILSLLARRDYAGEDVVTAGGVICKDCN